MVGTKHETTGTYRFTARSADFFTSRKGERESERRYDTTLARRKSNPPGTSGHRPGPTVRRETAMPARILAFAVPRGEDPRGRMAPVTATAYPYTGERDWPGDERALDRKSTRLNSSHLVISYAV